MSNDIEILKPNFVFDRQKFEKKIHLDKTPECRPEIDSLLENLLDKIRPKVAFIQARLKYSNDTEFSVNGANFNCPVFFKLVKNDQVVVPFICTCGNELENIDFSGYDFMAPFWIDTLKELALEQAVRALKDHVKTRMNFANVSFMSPGSADTMVWDITQQQNLFSLFGNSESLLGVTLTSSCLMVPNKSASGIMFSTEKKFSSCQLCTRKDCPQRKEKCEHFVF